ncbi:MAG: hypothetical protein KKF10_00065, partial [Verrucomicrobia bacterium]|nr:hypothetical protein [Verrucomicrobiota bacterium]
LLAWFTVQRFTVTGLSNFADQAPPACPRVALWRSREYFLHPIYGEQVAQASLILGENSTVNR